MSLQQTVKSKRVKADDDNSVGVQGTDLGLYLGRPVSFLGVGCRYPLSYLEIFKNLYGMFLGDIVMIFFCDRFF
jgi:hypothetical protein